MKEPDNACSREGIAERTVSFSLQVVGLYRELEGDGAGRMLAAILLSAKR